MCSAFLLFYFSKPKKFRFSSIQLDLASFLDQSTIVKVPVIDPWNSQL